MIILGYWNEQGETPGHDTTRQLKLIAPASRQRQIYRGNRHYLQTCTSTCALSSFDSLELDFRTFNAGFTPTPLVNLHSSNSCQLRQASRSKLSVHLSSLLYEISRPKLSVSLWECSRDNTLYKESIKLRQLSYEKSLLWNSLFLYLVELLSILTFGIDIFYFYIVE